jgi:hypothetical protein
LRRPVSFATRMRSSAGNDGAGRAAVAQFEVGELAAGIARRGLFGERGRPVAVPVGQSLLRTRVRQLSAHDHPHPGRPARQVEQPGHLHDRGAGAGFPVGVVGDLPGGLRDGSEDVGDGVGQGTRPNRTTAARQPVE